MSISLPACCAGGKAVLFTGPFGEPDRVIGLPRPMTIAEIVALHGLNFRLPTIAIMDGEPVLRAQWAVRMVRASDVLGFVAIPGNSGGGGKQIIGLVAAIALAIAAPMVGGWVAGSVMGLTGSAFTIGSSLVSGLVLAGGSFLVNMLFPPVDPGPEKRPQQVYLANAASNQATPFETIPVLYGRERFPPRFAARPYSEFQGNDQFLYQLFAITLGKADIERIDIGETEAWNADGGYSPSFSDLEIEIIQPGKAVTLFPANVITSTEVANQTVPDPPDVLGPFVVNAAGTEIDRIAVDFMFPGGLFAYDDKGKIKKHAVSLRAQYQRIDDAGAPIGGWSTIFASRIEKASRTPQRMTESIKVPAGRYWVRFDATQAFSESDKVISTVQWAGLRGYLTGFVTPPNCTLLAIKIRANEQLSQASASQIRVTAARHLEVWSRSQGAWVEQKTASIAWAAADILRNEDYSIGLPDTQYDLDWLLNKADLWASRGDEFNGLFDRSWTVSDALRAVLRVGRAQPVRIGGKIGFTRLEPKHIKRAVFTPRNVVRGSFQHELVLFDEDKPDHVVGEYRDRTVWDTREVRASLAAIGSDAPQRIEYFGITDHDHAWREAVTDAAINAYQRELVAFTAEWEGKMLVRGDPVLVHHPFIEEVATAALVERTGRTLTIDREYAGDVWDDSALWFDLDPWEGSSAERYVILRDKRGREWGPCRVEAFEGRTLVLDADDLVTVQNQMGSLDVLLSGGRQEPPHVLICAGETRPFNGLVVSAAPNGPDRVDIVTVIDAPEVYMADGEEVMPSPWTPPTLPPAVPLRPIILGLSAQLRSTGAGMELDAAWQPAIGAISYVAEVSYDGEQSWTPVTGYDGRSNRFTVPVLPQTLSLRVAALGNVQGPWVIRAFVEGELPDVRIPSGWIDVDGIAHDVKDSVTELSDWTASSREFIERLRSNILMGALGAANAYSDRQDIRREMLSVTGQSKAEWTHEAQVLTAANIALAQGVETLRAEVFDPATGLPATASAVEDMTVRVSTNEDEIFSVSQQFTDLTAQVNAPGTGLPATANAVSLLSAEVLHPETGLEAIGNSILSLVSSVPGASADSLLRFYSAAAPAGATARAVLSVAATTGGATSEGALYIDAVAGGKSRVVINADQFALTYNGAGGAVEVPFALDDGRLVINAKMIGHAMYVDPFTGFFSFGGA